jgi:hypothetical protein
MDISNEIIILPSRRKNLTKHEGQYGFFMESISHCKIKHGESIFFYFLMHNKFTKLT